MEKRYIPVAERLNRSYWTDGEHKKIKVNELINDFIEAREELKKATELIRLGTYEVDHGNLYDGVDILNKGLYHLDNLLK